MMMLIMMMMTTTTLMINFDATVLPHTVNQLGPAEREGGRDFSM